LDATTIGQLLSRRAAGHVRIGAVRTYPTENLSTPLARLGVAYSSERCREIDESEARRMLTSLFSEDLAYRTEVMPRSDAERFADFVLREVFPPGSKLLTNIEFHSSELFRGDYGGLFLGVDATFTVGIIAQTESVVACVWFEDED
jgi:hypothetical protein